jgi:hypothetical protein
MITRNLRGNRIRKSRFDHLDLVFITEEYAYVSETARMALDGSSTGTYLLFC